MSGANSNAREDATYRNDSPEGEAAVAKRGKTKAISKQGGQPGPEPKVLDSITGDDALAILKVLVRDRRLAQEIERVAREHCSNVEMHVVAANVATELDSLDIEDVWDRSGNNRYGYVEPSEAAWEVFDEALRPFRDEVGKYGRLSMLREAELACQGILKGIYDFEKESSSEFKESAVDAPAEYFGMVLDDWKKLFGGRPPSGPLDRMTEFLTKHCAGWAEWAMKSLRPRKR